MKEKNGVPHRDLGVSRTLFTVDTVYSEIAGWMEVSRPISPSSNSGIGQFR